MSYSKSDGSNISGDETIQTITDDPCHDTINSILKKVLKKLKMSQEVEMKASVMVEDMLMEKTKSTIRWRTRWNIWHVIVYFKVSKH